MKILEKGSIHQLMSQELEKMESMFEKAKKFGTSFNSHLSKIEAIVRSLLDEREDALLHINFREMKSSFLEGVKFNRAGYGSQSSLADRRGTEAKAMGLSLGAAMQVAGEQKNSHRAETIIETQAEVSDANRRVGENSSMNYDLRDERRLLYQKSSPVLRSQATGQVEIERSESEAAEKSRQEQLIMGLFSSQSNALMNIVKMGEQHTNTIKELLARSQSPVEAEESRRLREKLEAKKRKVHSLQLQISQLESKNRDLSFEVLSARKAANEEETRARTTVIPPAAPYVITLGPQLHSQIGSCANCEKLQESLASIKSEKAQLNFELASLSTKTLHLESSVLKLREEYAELCLRISESLRFREALEDEEERASVAHSPPPFIRGKSKAKSVNDILENREKVLSMFQTHLKECDSFEIEKDGGNNLNFLPPQSPRVPNLSIKQDESQIEKENPETHRSNNPDNILKSIQAAYNPSLERDKFPNPFPQQGPSFRDATGQLSVKPISDPSPPHSPINQVAPTLFKSNSKHLALQKVGIPPSELIKKDTFDKTEIFLPKEENTQQESQRFREEKGSMSVQLEEKAIDSANLQNRSNEDDLDDSYSIVQYDSQHFSSNRESKANLKNILPEQLGSGTQIKFKDDMGLLEVVLQQAEASNLAVSHGPEDPVSFGSNKADQFFSFEPKDQ